MIQHIYATYKHLLRKRRAADKVDDYLSDDDCQLLERCWDELHAHLVKYGVIHPKCKAPHNN